MHFSVSLPTDRIDRAAEFVTQIAVTEIAKAAEGAGFDACFVTDHPFPPHRWLHGGGHHALDPFVALSFAAAATSKLRLQTHILVLPYRNPFVTAKAVLSLDVLSGGRVILGVAAGYLKGEFAALGADFEARQEVSDDFLRAMKLAWAGDDVQFEGRGFNAAGNSMGFRPVQQPHPPIWVGGNSRAAIRRAVELADGWVPFPNTAAMSQYTRTPPMETLDDLKARIAIARELATASGRKQAFDICYSLMSMAAPAVDPGEVLGRIAQLRALGVTWLTVGFRADTRREYIDAVQRFSRQVIANPSIAP
ncbi:MAG TPA: LLM class F420-dependent oxidoreductase [Candidatus Acidoferrales bacterium]|nr:LLM class F420-dependent oxidoreductase [Candidatus Acidoferrales bacterium]